MSSIDRRSALKAMLGLLTLVLATVVGTSTWAPRAEATPVELRGEIVRIGDGQFVLDTRRGRVTVAVTSATVIVRNGERVRFSALQIGDKAAVRGRADRENQRVIASHVRARGR